MMGRSLKANSFLIFHCLSFIMINLSDLVKMKRAGAKIMKYDNDENI